MALLWLTFFVFQFFFVIFAFFFSEYRMFFEARLRKMEGVNF